MVEQRSQGLWDKPWLSGPTFSSPAQGAETILQDVISGVGYGLCCCDCRRVWSVTSQDLLERFAGMLGLTMREAAARLVCRACGGRRLYLWPYRSARLYAGGASAAFDAAHREQAVRALAEGILAARRGSA